MIQNIKWKDGLTTFLGRNGTMKCGGVELLETSDKRDVLISPLTSRGDVGRCDILIPKSALPEIIAALQSIPKPIEPLTWSQFRRRHKIAKWERRCRLTAYNGRVYKAYKVPGTSEHGQMCMFRTMFERQTMGVQNG